MQTSSVLQEDSAPIASRASSPSRSLANLRALGRAPGRFVRLLPLLLLLCAGEGRSWAQFGDRLIRNYVPPAWQAENLRWIRDVQPRNKIDDTVDASLDDRFDVVVNFKRCVTDNDIAMLNGPAGQNRLQMRLKYLSSVAVAGLTKAEIRELAALPDIAFIEQQFGFSPALDISVPSICVRPGSVSCAGNARALGYDGTGVNIAVIDTGVDNAAHAAFAATPFVGGYNAITHTFGDPDDDIGHGTHVASIALGQATANTAEGLAPHAGLIDVKVIAAGATCATPGQWALIVEGLQMVYDQRAVWNVNVINMSLQQCNAAGFIPSDGLDAFSQLVDLAESMGIVVVAAASNNGPGNSGLPTPAAATRAIAVAAADDRNTTDRSDDTMASFSSRGPRDSDGDADQIDELKPEVTAPGVNINAARFNTANGVSSLSGTSMASPHVAGLAALIMQARPGINAASVKALIISTAEARGGASLPGIDPIWNNRWGWGLINGYAAVSVAQQSDLTFPSYPPPVSWLSPDISTAPYPPHVGVPTTVTVLIQNRGPSPATGVQVHFGVWVFSAAPPAFYDIGTRIVDVPVHAPGASLPVSISWTPALSSHQCVKVEIGYGPDTDYSNNTAQRNITVQMSPVAFEVRNTLTDDPTPIQLTATVEGTNGPVGNQWSLQLEPREIVLGAMDCPQLVRAELFPGPEVRPGERVVAHVAAVIQTFFGPEILGGITFEAIKPVPPTIQRPPRSVQVPCGSTVSFDVAVTGTDPLVYQWSFNRAALPGATDPALTLYNVGLAQQGGYFVTVSNEAGGAMSEPVTLKVLDIASPKLAIAQHGNDVLITWPQGCTSYLLRESPDLNSPIRWSPANVTVDLAGGQYAAAVAITSRSRFFQLLVEGTNQINVQPPPLPNLPFAGLELTLPPTPADALEIVAVPWSEIPGALTDTLVAQMRQVALQTPVVRELLGVRFAFISASQDEPAKGQAGGSGLTRLVYFSHDHNVPVLVFMNGTQVSDVVPQQGYQPPEGANEVAEAIDIARRDERLRNNVVGLVGDAILYEVLSPNQPGFGDRVLYVTFSRGDQEETPLYTAVVDLTTQSVLSVRQEIP